MAISCYSVPERKPGSVTIPDFRLRIKKTIFTMLMISEQNRKIIFRGFRSDTIYDDSVNI